MSRRKREINIEPRRASDGRLNYRARVRLTGYKPASRTFGTRQEAEGWANDMKQQLTGSAQSHALRKDAPGLTVADWLREFLRDPNVKLLVSFDDYARDIGWFITEYGTRKLLSFGRTELFEARDKLLAKGLANATVVRYLAPLRAAWHWAQSKGLMLGSNVWPRRHLMPKLPRGRVRFLSEAELGALARTAQADPVVWCAVIVSIATGVRQSEAMRLTWEDIDLDRKTAVIHLSKNDEARTVHLPPEAVTALKRLPLSGVKYVFVNDDGAPMTTKRLWKRWDIVRSAAGLRDKTDKAKNFTWHDLRHTAASYLAQGGASLPQIGSVLGHKSVQSTARYAHLVQGAPITGHDNINNKLREVQNRNGR